MRVLIYEHLTALDPAGTDAMTGEGRAMRDAIAADFGRFAEVAFSPLADAGRFEWSLVIAPETDGILEECVRKVMSVGGRPLNCSPDAIRLCGDKLALFRHWTGASYPLSPASGERGGVRGKALAPGVAIPLTLTLSPEAGERGLVAAGLTFPVVIKPRFGCGSTATTLVHSPEELAAAEHSGEMIVQEFVPGLACSLAFLCGPTWRVPLVPSTQQLSDDGRFHYRGGDLPLSPDIAARAVAAATAAVECVPGLFGYVGVDLVLGNAGDFCIEMNPRLSTSYVGLRALAESNLAAAMVAESEPELKWQSGTVRFTAAGAVTREPAGPLPSS